MADSQKLHSEFAALLNSKVEELRSSLTSEMRKKLEATLEHAPGTAPTDQLNGAIEAMQQFTAQADILRSLLDGAARFSGRSALFVVKGNSLTGWQGRGFAHEDRLKSTNLDAGHGPAGRAIRDRSAVGAAAQEFDSAFISQQGAPSDGNAWLLPLLVRDKVAAVLYSDAGVAAKKVDSSALQILVRAAGQWLEILTARKTSGMPEVATAASVSAGQGSMATTTTASQSLSADENELHTKAQRFAKLLVDEIRLYNQAKVKEGRQSRELYKVLREDIEKSRDTYNRRYANTSVADAGYFTQEVIRILADNDASLLGSDFPG
ncbi:MAG TPA: hypothetical protein VF493_22620 [Terriglobales bacterium]